MTKNRRSIRASLLVRCAITAPKTDRSCLFKALLLVDTPLSLSKSSSARIKLTQGSKIKIESKLKSFISFENLN